MPDLPDATSTTTDAARAARRLGPSPWPWMIVACALVAGSGLVRVNQERQFADAARAAETAPFPMRDLPRELGGHWHMDGEERFLDAETQQIAGCSDYMYRSYVDDRTGVRLTVLVAFGPADRVFYHSPVECFPANGFQHRGGPWRRNITAADPDPESKAASERSAPFAALAYGKSGGGIENLTEVYYSFWHDGRWSPYAEGTDRLFRHRPAMFKVQVERLIVPDEIGVEGSPIEDFVAELIPELERRMASPRGRAEA